MAAELVVPGQVIGNVSTHLAGDGTHVHDQAICASIIGSVVVSQPQPQQQPSSGAASRSTNTSTSTSKPTLSIPRHTNANANAHSHSNSLPKVGSTVLCRVLRVQQRQLIASILVTDPTAASSVPLTTTTTTNDELQFQAVLRREDVRGYDKDKIVMNDMFRTADIIRAVVISLGDERSYYISTVGNDYGVLIARSEAGNPMVPATWNSMLDPVTRKVEARKVAKPASSSSS